MAPVHRRKSSRPPVRGGGRHPTPITWPKVVPFVQARGRWFRQSQYFGPRSRRPLARIRRISKFHGESPGCPGVAAGLIRMLAACSGVKKPAALGTAGAPPETQRDFSVGRRRPLEKRWRWGDLPSSRRATCTSGRDLLGPRDHVISRAGCWVRIVPWRIQAALSVVPAWA